MLPLAALVTSCWHEGQKECDSYISFRYTYNIPGGNLYHREVSRVQLLMFDDNGTYQGQIDRSAAEEFFAEDHSITLPPNLSHIKQIVTLGGEHEGAYTMSPSTLVPGSTNINDITLTVKPLIRRSAQSMPAVFHGGRIVSDKIKPTGDISGMPVNVKYLNESHEVEFMKISKVFRLLLKITENDVLIPGSNFDFEIIAPNSVLDMNAEPIDDRLYTHVPYLTKDVENTNYYAAEIWTPRLKSGADQKLVIKEKAAPHGIAFEEDLNDLLYALMIQSEEDGVENFQEFLDRKDKFVIALILKKVEEPGGGSRYLSSKITINGWVVRDDTVDP